VAIVWNAIETFGKQFITFVITIVLARLLHPEDFGLIGMITVFVMIANVVVDGGFMGALVYKKIVGDSDYDTVFHINLATSLVLYGGLYLVSGAIADFYDQPKLTLLLRWLSVSMVLGSFSIVHYAMYYRKMDFKPIAKVGLLSQTISGVIAIVVAALGGGVWALVVQHLLLGLLTAVFFWTTNPWRPKWRLSRKSFRSLFGYGTPLMLTYIMQQVFDNLFYVIIGKFYNPLQLGYYVQANKIQRIPALKIQEIIKKATFPAFTRIAEDAERTVAYFKTLFTNTMAINFPVLIALSLFAESVIPLLLTEKWSPIVPYIQLLCMASLFLPFYSLCSNIVLSMGHSLLNFRIEALKNLCILISVPIAIQWGIIGLIIGQILCSLVFVLIHLYFVKTVLPIKRAQFLIPMLQYLGIAFAPFFVVKTLMLKYPLHPVLNLLVYGSVYFLIYIGLMFSLNMKEAGTLKKLLNHKL